MKAKLLFKDKAGNTLWSEYIKTRETHRLFAKNASGKLVDREGVFMLAKKGGVKTSGINRENNKKIKNRGLF